MVDRDGKVINEDNTNGEVHIKAPHPMKGYLNNPTATAEAFASDGWVCTGDIGYVRKGRWYIIDRTKDLIKVRGWQVSPAEIENSLLEHDEIIDAAVIGIPAPDAAGEVPLAFIVRVPTSTLTEATIKAFLAPRLARYKAVHEVRFVDVIPRNPTGKILRRVLRDARSTNAQVTTGEAATAYSNAIKHLEKYQKAQRMERSGHSRTTSAASLTDASTIDDSGPATPPGNEEFVSVSTKSSSSAKSKKRKGEPTASSSVKRRSARIAVVRVRSA